MKREETWATQILKSDLNFQDVWDTVLCFVLQETGTITQTGQKESRCWLCVDQSECPCRLLKSLKHHYWTQWKKVTWSVESRFHLHHMALGWSIRRKQHDRDDVMLWAMFWETLGSTIYAAVTWTPTAYLSIDADHIHLFHTSIMWWLWPLSAG